jgi:hypothetical protein
VPPCTTTGDAAATHSYPTAGVLGQVSAMPRIAITVLSERRGIGMARRAGLCPPPAKIALRSSSRWPCRRGACSTANFKSTEKVLWG